MAKAKTKVYIAGAVTDDPDYKNKFKEAEQELKKIGMKPVNPVKDAPEGLSYKEYIDRGLRLLAECDAIYMLPGWKKSKGAMLEFAYSVTVAMPSIQPVQSRAWLHVEDEMKIK